MDTFYMDNTFPKTYEQKVANQKAFIDTIDLDAVCSLASLHNGGRPCRIFKEPAHGSFNVCFFVEFVNDEPTTATTHPPPTSSTAVANTTAASDSAAAADSTAAAKNTADNTATPTIDIDTITVETTMDITTATAIVAYAAATTETTTETTPTTKTIAINDTVPSNLNNTKDAGTIKPTTKWVVRVPTLPTVYDPWEKICGEVATIRFLESNTKIKVPHVHAFGPAVVVDGIEKSDKAEDDKSKENSKEGNIQPADIEAKTNDSNPIGYAYMIIDYIAGDKLDIIAFIKAKHEKRVHFFGQLIDVFAELVDHEFDKGGSLTLNDAGEPVLGPLQSMHLDGLRMDLGNKGNSWTPTEGWTRRRRAPKSTMFLSAADYALFQYRLVREAYLQPTTDVILKNFRFEEMILHDAKGLIFDAIDYEKNHGPFVLNHTDLRWSNIIVNDDFDILGVVDWEWSAVIPSQFLVPPFWIAGEEAKHVGRTNYGVALIFFQTVLRKKKKNSPSPGCLKLDKIWASLTQQSDRFVVSYLLRHHHEFVSIYNYSILHEKRKLKPDEFIQHHLALTGEDGPLAKEAQRKLEYAQKYVQYLGDNGLLVEDKDCKKTEKTGGEDEVTAGPEVAAADDNGGMADKADGTKSQDWDGTTSGLEDNIRENGVC